MEKVLEGQSIIGDLVIESNLDTESIGKCDFLHGTITIPSNIVCISFDGCFFDDIRFNVSKDTEEIIFQNCDLLSTKLGGIPESCVVTILTTAR